MRHFGEAESAAFKRVRNFSYCPMALSSQQAYWRFMCRLTVVVLFNNPVAGDSLSNHHFDRCFFSAVP